MRTPEQQASDFIKANDKSLVVSGYAVQTDPNKPGKGAVYTLKDRSTHVLGRAACALLPDGYPKWDLPE